MCCNVEYLYRNWPRNDYIKIKLPFTSQVTQNPGFSRPSLQYNWYHTHGIYGIPLYFSHMIYCMISWVHNQIQLGFVWKWCTKMSWWFKTSDFSCSIATIEGKSRLFRNTQFIVLGLRPTNVPVLSPSYILSTFHNIVTYWPVKKTRTVVSNCFCRISLVLSFPGCYMASLYPPFDWSTFHKAFLPWFSSKSQAKWAIPWLLPA